MPKRRHLVRMTEEEAWDFVRSRQTLQVATLDRTGAPHLTTLWFAVVDGEIVFHSYEKSQKVVNLRRDPRIAVLVEDGSEYDELRGVSIQGRAELIDSDEKYRYVAAVSRRLRAISREDAEASARLTAAKRTVVVVKPEKIISWDHRKIAGT